MSTVDIQVVATDAAKKAEARGLLNILRKLESILRILLSGAIPLPVRELVLARRMHDWATEQLRLSRRDLTQLQSDRFIAVLAQALESLSALTNQTSEWAPGTEYSPMFVKEDAAWPLEDVELPDAITFEDETFVIQPDAPRLTVEERILGKLPRGTDTQSAPRLRYHRSVRWRGTSTHYGQVSVDPSLLVTRPDRNPVPSPYKIVDVFFGTNRKKTDSGNVEKLFSGTKDNNNTISWGKCAISVPLEGRVMGELPAPSLFRFEFRNDPKKHVYVKDIHVQTLDEFRAELNGGDPRSALVYVHGFNVNFNDAARRCGQMHVDLNFKGTSLFFSWPSQGNLSLRSYTADKDRQGAAASALKTFLEEVLQCRQFGKVFFVAHSMGNLALTRALIELLKEKKKYVKKIGEIIFAAPDIDADEFRNVIAPAFNRLGCPMTLYAASDDVALAISRQANQTPRAGDASAISLYPGVESIDATGHGRGFAKHSSYADTRSLLFDISTLIHHRIRAAGRQGLLQMNDAHGNLFWKLLL